MGNFFPIITLLSFVGAMGVLMSNTGLKELLESAFGSVDAMLKGGHFQPNVRALRMCTVEVLRTVFEDEAIQDTGVLTGNLMNIANWSRTAKLWCNGLIKPVFIIMMFVRSAREAD